MKNLLLVSIGLLAWGTAWTAPRGTGNGTAKQESMKRGDTEDPFIPADVIEELRLKGEYGGYQPGDALPQIPFGPHKGRGSNGRNQTPYPQK